MRHASPDDAAVHEALAILRDAGLGREAVRAWAAARWRPAIRVARASAEGVIRALLVDWPRDADTLVRLDAGEAGIAAVGGVAEAARTLRVDGAGEVVRRPADACGLALIGRLGRPTDGGAEALLAAHPSGALRVGGAGGA